MMGVDILGGVLFVKREKLCVKVLDGAFPFSEGFNPYPQSPIQGNEDVGCEVGME